MTEFIVQPPTSSKPGSFPPSEAIPVAPPPWSLKAKAWTFLYTEPGESETPSPQNVNNNPDILQGILPLGAYHPFEHIHAEAVQRLAQNQSQYRNGLLKGVMIVRYEDSDVGPYDELILIPGRAVNPHTGKSDMRISTIYVSTDASVWNGRRNWNIPKQRAVFDFQNAGKSDLALKVYHPDDVTAPLDPKIPFFTVLLKGSSLPKIPLPELAPMPVVQPPLAKSRWPTGVQNASIATDDPDNGRQNPWLKTTPSFKGYWGVAYPAILEDGENTLKWHGDGIGFPEIKFWSVGTAFEGTIGFGVSTIASNSSSCRL